MQLNYDDKTCKLYESLDGDLTPSEQFLIPIMKNIQVGRQKTFITGKIMQSVLHCTFSGKIFNIRSVQLFGGKLFAGTASIISWRVERHDEEAQALPPSVLGGETVSISGPFVELNLHSLAPLDSSRYRLPPAVNWRRQRRLSYGSFQVTLSNVQ